jgi:hypothetical protein
MIRLLTASTILFLGVSASADLTLPAAAYQEATTTAPIVVRSARPSVTYLPSVMSTNNSCPNGICRPSYQPAPAYQPAPSYPPRTGYQSRTAYQPRQVASVSRGQQAAQAQANEQARRGRMGHLLPMRVGSFEGVGMSSSPNNIPTCTPRRRMTLIGDARAQGRNGRWYRCRIWQ